AAPDVDGSCIPLTVGAVVPTGVDAVRGKADLLVDGHVGGAEAQVAGSLVAVDHLAAHLVDSAQHGVRVGQPALPQRCAHRRGADLVRSTLGGVPVDAHEADRCHLEAQVGAHHA